MPTRSRFHKCAINIRSSGSNRSRSRRRRSIRSRCTTIELWVVYVIVIDRQWHDHVLWHGYRDFHPGQQPLGQIKYPEWFRFGCRLLLRLIPRSPRPFVSICLSHIVCVLASHEHRRYYVFVLHCVYGLVSGCAGRLRDIQPVAA